MTDAGRKAPEPQRELTEIRRLNTGLRRGASENYYSDSEPLMNKLENYWPDISRQTTRTETSSPHSERTIGHIEMEIVSS